MTIFILLLIIVLIILMFYGIALYLVYFILDRNTKYRESTDSLSKDPEEAKRGIQILCGSDEWKREFAQKAELRSLYSKENLLLKARFLKNDSHNYVILCHGFTGKYTEMLGRAEYFYRKNFCVILPDARAHGDSEGKYRGMGWLEIDDIKKWINKILEMDNDARILLFGQSMGAATVMNVGGEILPNNVKAIIQDCGYISVWDEFAKQMKIRYHLPAFPIMHIADKICKRKAGYSFREASPLNQISKCKLPILMIHGEEDNFVPCEYIYQLYEKANEPKYKLIVEGAGHCMSIAKENELYWNTIDEFVKKYIV